MKKKNIIEINNKVHRNEQRYSKECLQSSISWLTNHHNFMYTSMNKFRFFKSGSCYADPGPDPDTCASVKPNKDSSVDVA